MPSESVDLTGALHAFFTAEFEKGNPAATQAAGFVLAFELFPITLAPEVCLLDEADLNSFVPARQQEMITRLVVDHASMVTGAYRLPASDWMSDTYIVELVGPARYLTNPGADPALEADAATHFAVVREKAQNEFRTAVSVMGQPDDYAPSDALPSNWLDLRQNDNWLTYAFSATAPAPTPVQPSPTPQPLTWRAIDATVLASAVNALEGATPSPAPEPEPAPTPAAGRGGAGLGSHIGRSRIARGAANLGAIHGTALSHEVAEPSAPPLRTTDIARASKLQGLEAFGRTAEPQQRKTLTDLLLKQPVKRDVQFNKKLLEARAELAGVLLDAIVETPPAPTTDNVEVRFQYQVVRIGRPWIFFPFLRHANWYVPGMKAGAISNPATPEAPGRMGLVPVALLVIRDLSITANWSEHDVAELDKSFALGPFGKGIKAQIVGNVLKCDGVQVIGCISEHMPMLPPRSDPALGAMP